MKEPKAIRRTESAPLANPADPPKGDDVRLYENPDGTVVGLLRHGEVIVTLEITSVTSHPSA